LMFLFSTLLLFSSAIQINLQVFLFDCYGLFSGTNPTFYYSSTKRSWTEAQSFCREHYRDLAGVRHLSDNKVIQGLVQRRAWIGLYNNAGQWKWADGSKFLFTHWKSGKPDKSTDTSVCAVAYFQESGSWEDEYCDIKRAFICYEGKPPAGFSFTLVEMISMFK
uniref:C-type lectin domain-containing protein n=1 Tax=Xiphophorus couchianus TaxID=32473 RepID=A0A3B5MER5_9TELE